MLTFLSQTEKSALEKLDYEYNTLMSSLHVSVSKHLLDEHFTVIWANDFYYEKIGYPKEEYERLFHNHVDEYFRDAPELLEPIVAVVMKALNGAERRYETVCRMPQKGGSHMWTHLVGTFTNERINGLPVVYTVFTDVTDLVQTQMEKSITYDNLPGFIAKFKVGGTVGDFGFVEANDRFIDFFGERPQDGAAYGLVNVDTDRNGRAVREHFPAMREGRPVRFSVQAQNRAGEDAWFQLNATCIDWADGDPIYLVVYIDITDITEQRELQKKLEERSDMLRNALEMAERANQAKSDFLSRMSHDIRTPMNAIMGMIAIAKESADDPRRVADCLDKVQLSAQFLLSLINDILDMSKIESGKMVLKKKPFDFAAFIGSITTMFYAEAEKRGIRFHVTASGDLREAYAGDELKLNQVLINLLGNALKFTDASGSVELSVRTGKLAETSQELIFTIKDTGTGMEKSFLHKLFQPFEQDGHQRGNRGGSGLGLAIARNYARMMNGDIEVESEPGAGSTFTAHLWLDLASERPGALTPKNRFRHMRALVVDADRETCAYAVRLLERFGARAAWALSGEHALAALADAAANGDPFTLAILDRQTPDMDGIALAETIRGRHPGREALCVAVAAYDWSGIRDEAERAGVDGFVQKPLLPSNIYDFLVSVTQDAPLSVEHERRETFSGERILLAEDNDINLEIAQTLLESRNLRVDTARDGLEAVERLRNSAPGTYLAVLMDIQMPVMDGLEATRRIRMLDTEEARTIPIIAMSANAFEEDVEKSLEAGMNGHISKPIDIPTLFDVLHGLKDESA